MSYVSLFFLLVFVSMNSLAADRVVVQIDGKNIMKSEVAKDIENAFGKLPNGKDDLDKYDPNMKKEIISAFVQKRLLMKEAKKTKITESKLYKKRLPKYIDRLKIDAYLESYANKNMKYAMVRDEYNKYIKTLKANGFIQVKHILFKTKEEANKVLSEIKAKKISFVDAVNKYSLDPMGKTNGGDVGIQPGQVAPEFEKAASALKQDEISKAVKTQFGWHLIKRTNKMPSFASLKLGLKHKVKSDIVNKHINALTEDSKVKIFMAAPKNKTKKANADS